MPWSSRAVALVVCAFVVGAACSPRSAATPGPSSAPAASAEPPPTPGPLSPPAAPPVAAGAPHVFVIVMENRSYSQAMAGGFTSQLASRYGVATNYHGITHPSLPNYLAITSGSTWGIADDGYHRLPAGGLGAQLSAAGITWRAYMQGMSRGCFNSGYPYALKHNPFAYYGGACPAEVVPFTRFAADMAGDVPRFVWITPDLCHDGHDCSTAVADAWLSQTVARVVATSAWKDGGVLFVTWDEGEDSPNSVLTLVVHANPTAHRSSRAYNHYSLLATIEDELGLGRLGAAARATPMTDLVASGAS